MQDQLRKDVVMLAEPGTRKVGSQGHEIAKAYLLKRMSTSGLIPYKSNSFELPYQIGSTNYVNLAGVLPGDDRRLDPILLVAHYDTCDDQPGADDNAAAIAIWFAVLELLKTTKLPRDIVFLFPDAEEPPRFLTEHMGSTNFYESQRVGNIHAGFVLDLVGHDVQMESMEDLLFIFGAESHRNMEELLLNTEPPSGLRNIATLNRYVGDLSDHHVLRTHGQPYLFFTCGRWQHYHQKSDKPENLNYNKMERIAQYLGLLVKQLATQEFTAQGLNHDPVAMELKLLERAIGPYLKQHGIPLSNRNDIQKFVTTWVSQYEL